MNIVTRFNTNKKWVMLEFWKAPDYQCRSYLIVDIHNKPVALYKGMYMIYYDCIYEILDNMLTQNEHLQLINYRYAGVTRLLQNMI